MRRRHSYGIVCASRERGELKLLMIKRTHTHHFCEFVLAGYSNTRDATLMSLFNNMTTWEKMLILTMRFQTLWRSIFLSHQTPDAHSDKRMYYISNYNNKKRAFDDLMRGDGAQRVRHLISLSCHVEPPLEFPKGRIESDETPLEAALREFHEETKVAPQRIRVHDMREYTECYQDYDAIYTNKYFYATSDQTHLCASTKISEVSSVMWVTRAQLEMYQMNRKQKKRMLRQWRIFEKIFRRVRRRS